MAVTRARYEADRAERAFSQVEPENRLVARSLENRWEVKLAAQLEAELALEAARAADVPLPAPDALAGLAKDLNKLWNAASTTARDRKRLIRTLIADVTVLPGVDQEHATIGLRWHTGAAEQINVRRIGPGRTPPDILEIIRAKAPTVQDRQIADDLNAMGLVTARGKPWDAGKVNQVRWRNDILGPRSQPFCPGEKSITEIAKQLGVSYTTVSDWIERGRVDAHKSIGNRWHVPWNADVEAKCRALIAASIRVSPTTRRTQGRSAV